jgi:hypothetical protein
VNPSGPSSAGLPTAAPRPSTGDAGAAAAAASAPDRLAARLRFARLLPSGYEDDGKGPKAPPHQVNRMLSVLAASGMLIGAKDVWTRTVINQHAHAVIVIAYYGALLVLGVLALSVRTRRALLWVDACMLAAAGIEAVNRFFTVTSSTPSGANHDHIYYGTDEGSLIHMAARTLLHGGHIYGTQWPQIFSMFHVGTTPLMNGGAATGLDYPPLGVIFTAIPMKLGLTHPSAGVAATGMLLLTSLVMFLLLPRPWRPVSVIVCYGFGWLPSYAQMGYPGLMELPFLLVAVAYWHRTGEGGKLGKIGVLRAVCLGLAACLHQLTWFLAPFLVVGMLMMRRGEMPTREAFRVVARYAAIALGVFLVINVPFIAQGPMAWLRGVLTPITQEAIPSGQGLIGISYFFTSGSGNLHLYSYAGLMLGGAMLLLLVVFPRRLGLAVTVMPWLVFYLSTRSQEDYFDLTVPLWVMAAATVSTIDLDRAYHWRPAFLRTRPFRTGVVVVLLAPAVACLGLAMATPPQLKMTILQIKGPDGQTGLDALASPITELTVKVNNDSGYTMTPHFATSTGATISGYWTVARGPVRLRPHEVVTYVLDAPNGAVGGPGLHDRILLRAVTATPMSLSTQLIGLGQPGPKTTTSTSTTTRTEHKDGSVITYTTTKTTTTTTYASGKTETSTSTSTSETREQG